MQRVTRKRFPYGQAEGAVDEYEHAKALIPYFGPPPNGELRTGSFRNSTPVNYLNQNNEFILERIEKIWEEEENHSWYNTLFPFFYTDDMQWMTTFFTMNKFIHELSAPGTPTSWTQEEFTSIRGSQNWYGVGIHVPYEFFKTQDGKELYYRRVATLALAMMEGSKVVLWNYIIAMEDPYLRWAVRGKNSEEQLKTIVKHKKKTWNICNTHSQAFQLIDEYLNECERNSHTDKTTILVVTPATDRGRRHPDNIRNDSVGQYPLSGEGQQNRKESDNRATYIGKDGKTKVVYQELMDINSKITWQPLRKVAISGYHWPFPFSYSQFPHLNNPMLRGMGLFDGSGNRMRDVYLSEGMKEAFKMIKETGADGRAIWSEYGNEHCHSGSLVDKFADAGVKKEKALEFVAGNLSNYIRKKAGVTDHKDDEFGNMIGNSKSIQLSDFDALIRDNAEVIVLKTTTASNYYLIRSPGEAKGILYNSQARAPTDISKFLNLIKSYFEYFSGEKGLVGFTHQAAVGSGTDVVNFTSFDFHTLLNFGLFYEDKIELVAVSGAKLQTLKKDVKVDKDAWYLTLFDWDMISKEVEATKNTSYKSIKVDNPAMEFKNKLREYALSDNIAGTARIFSALARMLPLWKYGDPNNTLIERCCDNGVELGVNVLASRSNELCFADDGYRFIPNGGSLMRARDLEYAMIADDNTSEQHCITLRGKQGVKQNSKDGLSIARSIVVTDRIGGDNLKPADYSLLGEDTHKYQDLIDKKKGSVHYFIVPSGEGIFDEDMVLTSHSSLKNVSINRFTNDAYKEVLTKTWQVDTFAETFRKNGYKDVEESDLILNKVTSLGPHHITGYDGRKVKVPGLGCWRDADTGCNEVRTGEVQVQ